MKKTFIYLVACLAIGLTACNDDDYNKDVVPPQSNEQEASQEGNFGVALAEDFTNPVVIANLAEDAYLKAVKITSTPSLKEGAGYALTVEVSPSANFDTVTELEVVMDGETALVSAGEVNTVVKSFYGVQEEAQNMYVRAFANILDNGTVARYNTSGDIAGPVSVTPQASAAEKAVYLYVPGNQQGWDPGSATKLYSENSDMIYLGFVYLDGEFKLTREPNWDGEDYGDAGDGKLEVGGDNLNAPEAGFYQLEVDLNTMTYALTKTAWGLIGDATPGGWDESTPMTYNVDNNTWTVTANLATGSYKFRANDSWDINIGGSEDHLVAEGGDMSISEAGNYTIVLYLTTYENSYCTVTKN